MMGAAESGDIELVKYHLSMGIDPNYSHPEFLTVPLIECLRKGHVGIARLLLENGADPTVKEGFSSDTALSMAKAQKNQDAIDLVEAYLNAKEGKLKLRNVLITGGNRGIGKAIARRLLNEGHTVLITSRNRQMGEEVCKELQTATQNPNISMIQADLSSIAGCQRLIEQIQQSFSEMDVLITNAGVWMNEKQINEDGVELSFMVNYLANYLLTKSLFPLLQQNAPARIVNVNAGLYIKGKVDVDKTPFGLDFHPIWTYAHTKLCGVMFNMEFAKEIQGAGVTLNAVHPGVIQTRLGDSKKILSRIVKFLKRFWKKPDYGAVAPSWLATSEEVEGIHGLFYNEKEVMPFADNVMDEVLRKRLMAKTEELLKD